MGINKIGLSSCGFALTEANFSALAESGIEAIEISMLPEQYKDINYRELADHGRGARGTHRIRDGEPRRTRRIRARQGCRDCGGGSANAPKRIFDNIH